MHSLNVDNLAFVKKICSNPKWAVCISGSCVKKVGGVISYFRSNYSVCCHQTKCSIARMM